MKSALQNIIVELLEDINEELKSEELKNISLQTKLYGRNGVLDSVALVSFITDLEERLSDELEVDIVLVDEKAMSQQTSPFRDIDSLLNYIYSLTNE
ncbi:hypothetical protein [Vibrio sp. HN007]|uniref:hypothetical protein n=1 Tax=Vibrio iocasae TaxID=3098914 RepID=UPI0035D4F6F0